MLNTRNVVATAAIVTLVSLVAACVSLVRSPAGGGLGVDTYGTRGHGYRGLFELLEELHVPVERADAPPNRLLDPNRTLALLEPSPEIVSIEPAYLHAIGQWVRAGGTVVVSPSLRLNEVLGRHLPTKNVLFELGLEGVSVRSRAPSSEERSDRDAGGSRRKLNAETRRALRQLTQLYDRPPVPPPFRVHAAAEGTLARLFPQGLELMLPEGGRSVLEIDSDSEPAPASSAAKKAAGAQKASHANGESRVPRGRVRAVLEPDGKPETLAAVYAVGTGKIVVLADARLAQNRLLAQGDNAILVSHLLADRGQPVVFDEFYHGLTVRANPLWLLSRFPYNMLAASILSATVLVGWRAARFLGPPLAARSASRRTLSEYIEAMARLLNRSNRPVPYLLREIRQGLLWRLRHDMGLPPGQEDAEKLVSTLQRRDPALAEKARDAIRVIDDALAHPPVSAKKLETALAKVSLCVPRHAV